VDWLLTALAITGMFIVRLGVPLAITLAVGYLLRRLDAKWQAEAWAQSAASPAQNKNTVLAQQPPDNPGSPCWVLKACGASVRAQCAAPQQPQIPCWMARLRAEGRLPPQCYHCDLFAPRPMPPSYVI
jgi:hypothetical protein